MKAVTIFNEIFDTFENKDIKNFAINKCVPTIPEWFWIAPAASSGRYHPQSSLGDGGLARHTVALCRFLNYMLEVESIHNQFTSRERDLMRVAGMMHDTRKSGSQNDYRINKQTKFDHPLLAAAVIRSLDGLPEKEIELCARIVESHMGQWNTNQNYPYVVLPKPQDKYQIMVHLADYLASRKDIEMRFDMDPEYKKITLPDIDIWKIPFGKHAGHTIREIYDHDPGYFYWAKDNIQKEPVHSLLIAFEEKKESDDFLNIFNNKEEESDNLFEDEDDDDNDE